MLRLVYDLPDAAQKQNASTQALERATPHTPAPGPSPCPPDAITCRPTGEMRVTNTLAIVLAGIIATALILDQVLSTGAATMFAARKIVDLIAYVSFWR